MAKKFVTTKGPGNRAPSPFYIGIPQHERTMSKKESYAFFAERTGYKPAALRAAFLSLSAIVKANAAKGNITHIDGIASVRHYIKGAFESLGGPWTKGRNMIAVAAVEMDPFKSVLSGIVPVNNTEGAKPVINTVLDETTGEYDVISGTDVFSIAGSDLAPDVERDDEYVAIVDAKGNETKAEIRYSDLQNVKASFASAPAGGDYTLVVYTRSGMGEEFGVHKATRRITVA